MKCLFCDAETKVINTKKLDNGKRLRTRVCVKCNETFKTYEVNEMELLNILDEFLPESLVDQISKKLFKSFEKLEKGT